MLSWASRAVRWRGWPEPSLRGWTGEGEAGWACWIWLDAREWATWRGAGSGGAGPRVRRPRRGRRGSRTRWRWDKSTKVRRRSSRSRSRGCRRLGQRGRRGAAALAGAPPGSARRGGRRGARARASEAGRRRATSIRPGSRSKWLHGAAAMAFPGAAQEREREIVRREAMAGENRRRGS